PRSPAPPSLPYTSLFRSGVRVRDRADEPRREDVELAGGEQALQEGRRGTQSAAQHDAHEQGDLQVPTAPDQQPAVEHRGERHHEDRKSTRLNSSHVKISY